MSSRKHICVGESIGPGATGKTECLDSEPLFGNNCTDKTSPARDLPDTNVNAVGKLSSVRESGFGERLRAQLEVLASFVSNRDALGLGYRLQFDSPYAAQDELRKDFLTRSGIKHRYMLFVRGLTSPQLTLEWLKLWHSPVLAPLKHSHPRVLLKLQRPYLQRRFSPEDRFEILRQHYSFVSGSLQAEAVKEISTCPGVLLGDLPVPEVGHFGIRLLYDNFFEKEGDFTLTFHDEEKKAPVIALTFCVSSNRPGQRAICIGGLQGCTLARDHDLIINITRGMHGMRPKATLLFAVQQLLMVWSIPVLRAVSNQTRVLPTDNAPVKADYDQFWIESDGQLDPDGNFSLPIVASERAISEIKPNKRAMYRRRYEFLEKLGGEIQRNAAALYGATHTEFRMRAPSEH